MTGRSPSGTVDGVLRPLARQIGQAHRLVVFDAVVRTGSFTAAATDLGVSQPAVSRQIALLEDELGLLLFHRDQNRAAPTENGQVLAEHLDVGFGHIEAGLANLLGRDEVLTVAVQPAIAEAWFSPRLDAAREAIEPATLQLVIFEYDNELSAIDHDIAVRFGTGRYRGTRSQLLLPEVAGPLCSPLFAARNGLDHDTPAEAFRHLRLLEVRHGGSGWLTWAQWFEQNGVDWVPAVDVVAYRTYSSVLHLALAGHGIVLGWQGLESHLREGGLLMPVGPRAHRPDLGYHLVWPTGLGRRESVRRLRAWLLDTVDELVAVDPLN